MRKRGEHERGGADAPENRPQPAAVPNDARFPRQRTTRTRRARRIRFTSCQTARASAHRAVHLDRPNTKARACSSRHANAQASGDGTDQVYTFGRRSFSTSIRSPEVRASLVLAYLRFLLPKQRVLTKLFSLFDANLKHTVSLRRPSMPNDGLKRCALRIDERCP